MRRLVALVPALLTALSGAEIEPKPYPDMAASIGAILRSDYYDPERFQPGLVLREGLRALEAEEIGIDAVQAGGRVMIRFADQAEDGGTEVASAVPQTLEEAMQVFDRIGAVLAARTGMKANRQRELMYAMLNGGMHTLDPHTGIMPPEPADDFAEEIQGEFFGIGAYLSQEEGVVRIDRVMAGLPADTAGVRDGDLVLAVDGEKTVGLLLPQVVRRIKGPQGSTVTLTIERAGGEAPFELKIVRDKVAFVTMRSYLHGDLGYVRMDEFNRNTAEDLLRQLGELLKQVPSRKLRGFVLDLRFNSGGLLTQAHRIADLFLPHSKEVVATVAPGGRRQVLTSSRKVYLDAPMLVLVGPGSASAAEIVAGALQLNDRAVVVGENTFGKGSVQMLRSLDDDSTLKLTTQEYQLTGEASIQGHGVAPDLALAAHSVDARGEVDLIPYTDRREGDHEFALKDHGTYQGRAALELDWLRTYTSPDQYRERHHLPSVQFSPDQEAMLALRLLEQALAGEDLVAAAAAARDEGRQRQFLIERLTAPVAAARTHEEERLRKALAEAPRPLAWGDSGVRPEPGVLKLSYTGPTELRAGLNHDLTFQIVNSGTVAAGRLYALVQADQYSPLWEEEIVIGDLVPGAEAKATLVFAVPPRLPDGEERFTLRLFQHPHREPVAELPVSCQVRAAPRPQFGYAWSLVQEEVADGVIALDENVVVELSLTNHGAGDAVATTLFVYKDDDVLTQLGEGRFRLEPIASGATATCRVPLRVQSELCIGSKVLTFSGEQITMQVRAEEEFDEGEDRRYRAAFFHALKLPIGQKFVAGAVHQPDLRLRSSSVDNGKLHLDLEVRDEDLRYLAIFVGDDKARLLGSERLAATDDGGLTWSGALELPPGLSPIRVVASDASESNGALFLRVWGPTAPDAEVEKTAARFEPPAEAPAQALP